MYQIGGILRIESSTISGNAVNDDGGGVYLNGGIVADIFHSTITGNTTNVDMLTYGQGGGISVRNGSVLNLDHTIVAANFDFSNSPMFPAAQDIENRSATITAHFSLIGDNSTTGLAPAPIGSPDANGNLIGTEAAPIDPLLGLLTNNGGATVTHALLSGSPAIDMGDPAFTTPPDFDQRGTPFARVVGGNIDIGAVEDQPIPDSADFDNDGDVDGGDFLAWQRGFGTLVSNATKGDGDADNDTNIDGDDLDIWEGQFGLAAPVVAAGSALNSASLAGGDLVDAALAVALAEKADDVFGEKEFAAHSLQPGFVSKREPHALASGNGTSQIEYETPEASADGSREDERGSAEGASRWEDALDEVLASVFD